MALLTDKTTEKDLDERLKEFLQFGMVFEYMLDLDKIDINDLEKMFFSSEREKATLIYSRILHDIKSEYMVLAFDEYSTIYPKASNISEEEYLNYLNKCSINSIINKINDSLKIDKTYYNTYDYLLNNLSKSPRSRK